MTSIDIIVLVIFAAAVVGIGLWKSKGEKDTSEDYFLAGRGLTWPLIGFSLIAANISAEQMVGMSGQSADREIGLAIASYEWMAAITLIGVGFFFLPKFLKAGIYTVPQFLEHRYDGLARTIMSLLVVVVLVVVNTSTVTYLGAKFLEPYFSGIGIPVLCFGIATLAAVYVAVGGLKACAWADIIQGAALIVGGAVITWLAVQALGDPNPETYEGINTAEEISRNLNGMAADASAGEKLGQLKKDTMHMFLPAGNSILPWTALIIGLWIPNFYYWGLNQYIMQRALGAKSLAEGQRGIVFAAGLKLVIPFVVCVPGIIAFTLYSGQMAKTADEGRNSEVIAEFQALSEPGAESFLVPFDGDFADRRPDLAAEMFAHNLVVAGGDRAALMDAASGIDPADGKEKTPGEVMSDANEAAIAAADAAFERRGTVVGYIYDEAFPLLVSRLAPIGFKGFVVAAVMGAVISSLASMLNAASTIFTMDLFKRFIDKEASQHKQVWVGRLCVPIAAAFAAIVAPFIDNPAFQGAFTFIQEFQGFISPGILTIFLFGLFVPKAPRMCGMIGLALSPVIYGALLGVTLVTDFAPGSIGAYVIDPFLNRMAITIILISIVLGALTAAKPLPEPVKLPENLDMELESSPLAKVLGIGVVIATVILYIVFA